MQTGRVEEKENNATWCNVGFHLHTLYFEKNRKGIFLPGGPIVL